MAENVPPSYNSKSWKYSPSGCSPLTSLALNLEDLSTRMDTTPKRRISWSSTVSTPESDQLRSSHKSDDGFHDSPVPMSDSPAFMSNSFRNSSSSIENGSNSGSRVRTMLQRLHSAPQSASPMLAKTGGLLRSRSLWSSPTKSVSRSTVAVATGVAAASTSPVTKGVRFVEDADSRSQDSGFCEKEGSQMKFTFTEPKGIPLRRSKNSLDHVATAAAGSLQMPSLILAPGSSKDEDDVDDNLDTCFLESLDDDQFDLASGSLPLGFTNLIDSKVSTAFQSLTSMVTSSSTTTTTTHLSPISNSSAFNHNVDTPKAKSCMRGLFVQKKDQENCNRSLLPFKRPDVPRDVLSPIQNKRRKSASLLFHKSDENVIPKKVVLQRHHSETHANIMKAVSFCDEEHNLIGDLSKPFVLPLIAGKHEDLKCISAETVQKLISGEFAGVEKFIIVDCRYPYEFDGGHIQGARNVYSKEAVMREFLFDPVKIVDANKHLVIIFHCEFSSERGPTMSRFLRNSDRDANKECYPHLHYPEIYLLDGGYKSFFEKHSQLCEPPEYKPMLHKDHEKDLRHFRSKCKSWNGDKISRLAQRLGTH